MISRPRLPRQALARITRDRKKAFPNFDRDLAKAVSKDMAADEGEVMSSVAFRGHGKGVNGTRTRQAITSYGWTKERHPYRAGNPEEFDVFRAFGVERKMTPFASETVTRLAATLGSFAETRGTLALLGLSRRIRDPSTN